MPKIHGGAHNARNIRNKSEPPVWSRSKIGEAPGLCSDMPSHVASEVTQTLVQLFCSLLTNQALPLDLLGVDESPLVCSALS